MLFPINPSDAMNQDSSLHHWTLLAFNKVDNKWTHYNSMLPRLSRKDMFLEKAQVVKDYVEQKILEIIERDGCGTTFSKSGEIACEWNTPQQRAGTLDCGVFTCIIMERLLDGDNPIAPITSEDVKNYRAKMAKEFVARGKAQKKEFGRLN